LGQEESRESFGGKGGRSGSRDDVDLEGKEEEEGNLLVAVKHQWDVNGHFVGGFGQSVVDFLLPSRGGNGGESSKIGEWGR
jgi:hypothetical protein